MNRDARVAPYAFDGPYAHCHLENTMAMDARHVYMIHGILTAWPFERGLELGSWWGASSTAFVEAINAGTLQSAVFCDPLITPGLLDVTGNCRFPERIGLTRDKSWEVLESGELYDFVLVDACHDLASVALELQRLVPRRPLCVMAHDTHASAAGIPHSEGARLLADTFRADPGYLCLEDRAHRAGERTERGLFFAAREEDLYRIAVEVFERFS